MSKTHFSRFREGVQISGVEMNVHQKGKVFYVNNSSVPSRPGQLTGSDNNNGLSPETPFSTLDYAIGQCVANRGDKIVVGPGHAETVSGATTIAMDVAGISIIGTGDGDQKPTFTFSATASNIAVSAANISMCHLKFIASASSVTAGVTVSASGFRAYDMETADTDATHCFAIVWQTTSGGDNIKVESKHRGFAASSVGTRYCDVVGCRDGEFNVDYFGNCSTSVVDMRTTACDNIRVFGTFYNDNTALTKNVTNNTTSTWSVEGYDAKAGRHFSGSDDLAVHYTDGSTSIEAALGTDGTTVTDSATTVLGAVGANSANNSFSSSSVVANVDGSVLERLEALMDPLGGYDPVLGFRVTKTSNMADGSGTDDLFTVTGRCLITHLSGEVTTQIGTTTTMKLTDTTNTVDLCAATTITSDAVGTMYALPGLSAQILNGTGGTPVVGSVPNVTTPSSNAAQIIGDSQAALTISHVLDGAGTGAVDWVLYYKPLTASSSIVAAA